MTLSGLRAVAICSALLTTLGMGLLPSCAADHGRTRGIGLTRGALRDSHDAVSGRAAVPSPLELGTFPCTLAPSDAPSTDALLSCESLRIPLAAPLQLSPLPAAVSRLLASAAEAIGANDGAMAITLASEAQRLAPDRVEPLELLLLGQLAQGSVLEVRATLDRISTLDAANPIGVAFRGLHAVTEGRAQDAIAHFAWFVEPHALARRGACIPLPIPLGELEEQAGICALRLGYATAALQFLDEAARMRCADASAIARLTLLQSDAHVLRGELDAATSMLTPLAALQALTTGIDQARPASDEHRALQALAQLRIDAIAGLKGEFSLRLNHAVAAFCDEERSDVAFWRVLFASDSAPPAGLRAARSLLDSTTHSHRAVILRVVLDSNSAATGHNFSDLADALSGHMSDRMALRCGVRIVAMRDQRKAIELVLELLAGHPNELDALADALLASGMELDTLMSLIESDDHAPEFDAIRSRILGKIGFPEEALLVAESARARDAANECVLAAGALAAAQLGDETLLIEIDDTARAAKHRIARTLAECWLTLGDAPRARDRAAEALRMDPHDTNAPEINIVDALMRTGSEFEALRLPLSAECFGLAAELDPSSDALEALALAAATVLAPPDLARWVERIWSASPALAKRRSLALLLSDRVEVTSIPATPMSARFDARCRASEALRAADLLAQTITRPKTAEAIAALARAQLAVGNVADAASIVTKCATGTTPTLSSRAARSLLLVATEVAQREPERGAEMREAANQFVAKLAMATPADIFAVFKLALLTQASSVELEHLTLTLARSVRNITDESLSAYFDVLEAIKEIDDDPFPAARLAAALARETRFEPSIRARIAAAAIALSAAAGAADESRELVRELASSGVMLFPRDGETELPLAIQFLRAAEVHALLRDAAGNDTLLRAALEADPTVPEVLNNIAYISIDRGLINEEVIEMTERAAALEPDNPAILDTLGLLRYHQGRFRDNASGPGAITLYRQALRLRPNDPSLGTLNHLGDALWRDGDQSEAIRCWQQIEQLASLRYPPGPIAQSLVEYQRRTLGVRLADPVEYVRRLYGDTVETARGKLKQTADGSVPSVPPCAAIR